MKEIQSIIKSNTQERIKAAKKTIQYDEDGNEIVPEVKKNKDEKPKSPIPIGVNNMRDMLQFSQNNEYFVFINRLTFSLDLYKLSTVSVKSDESFMSDGLLKEMSDDETWQKYRFVKVYNIGFEESDIFNTFKRAREANPELNVQDFILSNVSVSVENSGDVSMLHIIKQPQLKNVLVEICMFSQDNKPQRNTKSVVKNYNQEVAFHPTIMDQMQDLLEDKKKSLRE